MAMLKKHHVGLWERIHSVEKVFDLEVFYTPDGKANLKNRQKNGNIQYLHDINDPEREVPQFLDLVPENAGGVALLTGMGLGYTPIAILEKRKNIQWLAVFDICPDAFVQAMEHMDLSSMLSDPRLLLCFDPEPDMKDVFSEIMLALQLETIHDLKHIPSFSLDSEKYERLSRDVFSFANQQNYGGGAILGGGRLYTANRFKNLSAMYKGGMLEDLRGRYEGIPAVLVAAGPSLDLNIHLLSKMKGKCLIIAVDSAIPALLAHKIIPDFMTSIDPTGYNFEKIADLIPQMVNFSLITSAWATPDVVKVFPADKVFWTFSGRNMEDWMQKLMGGAFPTGGASTVAHLNLVAAILMGCSPIVFIGQDLCYTGTKTHASNIPLTEKETLNNHLNSKDLLWVEEIYGGKVPTDRLFLNFIRHFEVLIDVNPGHYINSTVQGAKIKGTEPMPLDEVIETYCLKEKKTCLDAPIVVKKDAIEQNVIDEFDRLLRESREVKKLIGKADKLQEKIAKLLNRIKKDKNRYDSFHALPEKARSQIRQIDRYHARIDGYQKIWGIMDELTMEGLKKSERLKHDISKLKKDPKLYLEWVSKNIERLSLINQVRKNELTTFNNSLLKLSNHFKTEKAAVENLKNPDRRRDALLALADLYFNSGDHALLLNISDEFEREFGETAVTSHYKGCVLLIRNEFGAAEKEFEKAVSRDSNMQALIKDFRGNLGESYIDHADFFEKRDKDTCRRMVIKGLMYGGRHKQLEAKFNKMADSAVSEIIALIDSDHSEEAQARLERWMDDFSNYLRLRDVLPGQKLAEFYKLSGIVNVRQQKFSAALDAFNTAISIVGNDPEYHLLKSDACFAINDYDQGVEALNQAVILDVNYAQYWENMGDNLSASGNFNDALAAYEQFLRASPENRMVLKKISKCFLELGQLDAAKQALVQLKNSYS
ncbi:MAG: DUF115 domain-containing protein [Desulfobacterales bacterium]|nr:DUF115 domain-containing protein [Desulfobacterales bacterium]